MQMMTWQRATGKHMTWQRRRITGGHLAHQIRGVTRGVVTCRGKRLAAVDALSRPGACRSLVLAGTRGASQQVSCRALVGFPGKLLLPGPCASSGHPGKLLLPGPCSLRVAFPASSSCRGLGSNTLFLDGPKRDHGESWRSPGKPYRGVLRLHVHKFGILRYPYFSTPTGAPGPGPYTVPSAVGPGPKQCTGTRGLGHTASYLRTHRAFPKWHASNAASWGEACVTWAACAGLSPAGMRHAVIKGAVRAFSISGGRRGGAVCSPNGAEARFSRRSLPTITGWGEVASHVAS